MRDWRNEIRQSLQSLKLDPTKEAEIVEELNQHLNDRFEELTGQGMAPEAAEAVLQKDITGGKLAAELKGVARQERPRVSPGIQEGGRWNGLWKDVQYGFRLLRLNPGFTIVAVLSLVLGIGANTAIFQLIDAVRLRTL